MKRLFSAAGRLLYPENLRCLLCNEEAAVSADGLCDDCRKQLRYCSAPAFQAPLDGLSAGLIYNDTVRAAVQRLKRRQAFELPGFFLRYMTIPADWTPDCIVPVPMHPLKEYRRRYNDCTLLAAALHGKYPSIPVRADLIRKIRLTRPQAGLSEQERRKNLIGSFAASEAARGLSILLVDDVVTTGNTLYACATALKKRGARRVYALCACSTER